MTTSNASTWKPGTTLEWTGDVTAENNITITNDDQNSLIETIAVDPITITIPTEAADPSLLPGYMVSGYNWGPGLLTISPTGIFLEYDTALYTNTIARGPWTVVKSRTNADTWILYGKLVGV